jgi:hypothetical protein
MKDEEIKHGVEITIKRGENMSTYVLPAVPHEGSDVMTCLFAALVHLEQRVCEIETEIGEDW